MKISQLSTVSLRFSIRSLLLLVAAASVMCVFGGPRYAEKRQIDSLTKVGVQVFSEPRGMYLIRQFVGDEIAQRAVYVHLDAEYVTDEWLQNVVGLRHVEVLSVRSPHLTDRGLVHLKAFTNLTSLNLVDTKITDAGLKKLRAEMPRLRLVTCRVTE